VCTPGLCASPPCRLPGQQGRELTRPLAGPKAATAVVEVVEAEDLLASDSGGEPRVHPRLLLCGTPVQGRLG